jgi:hypothetical protein
MTKPVLLEMKTAAFSSKNRHFGASKLAVKVILSANFKRKNRGFSRQKCRFSLLRAVRFLQPSDSQTVIKTRQESLISPENACW